MVTPDKPQIRNVLATPAGQTGQWVCLCSAKFAALLETGKIAGKVKVEDRKPRTSVNDELLRVLLELVGRSVPLADP
jgi:hypothetical protein